MLLILLYYIFGVHFPEAIIRGWPLGSEGRIYNKGKIITSFVPLTKENA